MPLLLGIAYFEAISQTLQNVYFKKDFLYRNFLSNASQIKNLFKE